MSFPQYQDPMACQDLMACQKGKAEITSNERRNESSSIFFEIKANPRLKRLQLQKLFHNIYNTHLMRSTDKFMKKLFLQLGSPRLCYLKERNISHLLVKAKRKYLDSLNVNFCTLNL